MECKDNVNKRTLKRRIRRIVYLCILITLVFFSSTIIPMGARFFKQDISIISGYLSTYLAQTMSTDQFLSQMGIGSLAELKPGNTKLKEWVDGVKTNSGDSGTLLKAGMKISAIENHFQQSIPGDDAEAPSGFLIDPRNFLDINIKVNGTEVYSDEDNQENDIITKAYGVVSRSFLKTALENMFSYFSDVNSAGIADKEGNVIASVTVNVSNSYIFFISAAYFMITVLIALIALIAGIIITKIFTIPVTAPICKLEERIKAIASDSNDAAMTSQIKLKRPLAEIESLADSTNTIMFKMREVNELLIAQNEELEAQNEELSYSKKKIEEAQTQLVQTENLASIGQLTAAITHEINTPLGAIHSNAQIFDMLLNTLMDSESLKSDENLREVIDQMKEANDVSLMACSRVAQIIRSLKNFSKVDQAEFQEADINEGIKSVLVLTSNLWKRNIRIHEEYGELPRIKCFPGMLNQVFMNIIVNAIQAIGESGDVHIRTWKDDDSVYASIRDTGCGISEENLQRIFDNGYTTKSGSLGMGLGLSISRNIMNKHKGEIKVSSKVGEGTEFTVVIPLKIAMDADQPAASATAAANVS